MTSLFLFHDRRIAHIAHIAQVVRAGECGAVGVSVSDDVVKSDRHADSTRGMLVCIPAYPHTHPVFFLSAGDGAVAKSVPHSSGVFAEP